MDGNRLVRHDGSDIFRNIPSPFPVIRYHSLAVYDIPDALEVTARAEDGTIMGIRHRIFPQWGVQFHPESICTEYGLQIFENFRKLTEDRQNEKAKVSATLSLPFKPAQAQATQKQARESLILLHKQLALDIDSETVFEKCFKNSEYAHLARQQQTGLWFGTIFLSVQGRRFAGSYRFCGCQNSCHSCDGQKRRSGNKG